MLAFPQLSSGAVAQFPIERETRFRARRSETADATVTSIGDPDFEERRWDLGFVELSDAEWAALESLFSTTKGRLGTFTFLEPGANLLAWSEDFAQADWQISGSVTPGQTDTFGGTAASLISAAGSVTQTIAAPADLRYAGSAWLKTTGAGALLRVSDGGVSSFTQGVPATGQWVRVSVLYQAVSATDAIELELVSGGAAPLEVYGAQLEAQISPSAYKKTTTRGGVFANTRFDQDVLVEEATGPGRHSTRIRLIWTPLQS